jgi:hypothetical protein
MIQKLTKLQSKINKITKDSANPFHKSRYASLEAILTELLPALQEEGIFLTQQVDVFDGTWYLETFLWDNVEHGDKLSMGKIPLIGVTDMQKLGSAVTYARRYGLQTALGLWASDDDSELAMNRHEPQKPAAAQKPVVKPVPAKPAPAVEALCNPPAAPVVVPIPAKPAARPIAADPVVVTPSTDTVTPLTKAPDSEPVPMGAERFDYTNAEHRKILPIVIAENKIPAACVKTIRLALEGGYWKDNVVMFDKTHLLFHMRKIVKGEK